MNILNLLTKEKHILGVEISDLIIRVAYLHPRKNNHKKNLTTPNDEIILIEEVIPPGIIVDGVIMDKVLLAKTLKNIWRKEKLYKFYSVISIPEDKIYSRVFPFPKTVNEDHLKQAVDLAIDFQLPFKKEDMYIGWEKSEILDNSNEVIISAIPKQIVNDYIKVFELSGVNVLALESHIFSIARTVKLDKDVETLITKRNQNSVTIFSLKNNIFKFSRTVPTTYINDDKSITREKDKIKESLESESKEKINELLFIEAKVKDLYSKYPELNAEKTRYKWLTSVGALIRREKSNDKDEKISLLPISTTEAYEYQRTKAFISLVRNMAIVISIFFVASAALSYSYLFSILQSTNNKIINIQTQNVSEDTSNKEKLVQRINTLSLTAQAILSNTPKWSLLINEIHSKVIDGIVISSFNAPSVGEVMSITGVARTRYLLNQFKETLQKSSYLTDIQLPITNLEQKGDIPFLISFRVKDPSMLYNK